VAHRTLGPFPKTLRWHEIIANAGGNVDIADRLLLQLRAAYEGFASDQDALNAVRFLIALVAGSRSQVPLHAISSLIGPQLSSADAVGIVKTLHELIPHEHPFRQAALKTVRFVDSNARQEANLFTFTYWQNWREYDGSKFCDLARRFYAHLNQAAFTSALAGVGLFVEEDVIERFAWEMSTITRSFSARWFNACARYQIPETGSIGWYLGHCLGKLDLELAREASDWIEPTGNPWGRKRRESPQLTL
jgi:hypothetical protein